MLHLGMRKKVIYVIENKERRIMENFEMIRIEDLERERVVMKLLKKERQEEITSDILKTAFYM